MNIEDPRDKDFKVVPIDVGKLYRDNGRKVAVHHLVYKPDLKNDYRWYAVVMDSCGNGYRKELLDTLHLSAPDSIDVLKADILRASSATVGACTACFYLDRKTYQGCDGCPARCSSGMCLNYMLRDIISRIDGLTRNEEDHGF